jgi:hypothetical protein
MASSITGEQTDVGQITSFMSTNVMGRPRAARFCAAIATLEIDFSRSYMHDPEPGSCAALPERHCGTSNGVCGTSRITMTRRPALVRRV